MKLLHGRLEIVSHPGAGTTVTAILPLPVST
jgi:signal transduction histidine kinase